FPRPGAVVQVLHSDVPRPYKRCTSKNCGSPSVESPTRALVRARIFSVLLLDERIKADGTHVRTWAASEQGRLRIVDDEGATATLSIVAVDRVMCRYGKPLDGDVALEGDALALDGSYRLRRLRHRAAVDADGRDYLVWERPDGEPLACIATMATAALRY